MLKKLFGNEDDQQSKKIPDRADLERLFAEIALEMPQVNWIVLTKSLFVVSFPSKPGVKRDRICAMGAAMSALGERIASELEDGELQYMLVAGTNGISITIELDPEHFLTIGLKKGVSIEEFLRRMQKTHLPPLMRILHLENKLQLSGIQQTQAGGIP